MECLFLLYPLYALLYLKLWIDQLFLRVRRALRHLTPSPLVWSKVPGHLLIISRGFPAHLSAQLADHLESVGVQCVSIQSKVNLDCTHKDFLPVKSTTTGMQVNLVTQDGMVTMCEAIERLKQEGDFTEDDITAAITPLPAIDLIIIFDKDLTLAGCVPWLVGLSEICHLPGMPCDELSMRMALEQYSKCQQRFGK